MRFALAILTFAAGGFAVAPGDSPASQPATAPASQPAIPASQPSASRVSPTRLAWPKYEVVYLRNIFVPRSGSERRGATSRPSFASTAPARTAASDWVLTGIAILDKEGVAFFENTQTGAAVRLRAGQSSEAGRLVSVDRDGATVEWEGTRRVIPVGSQLDGGAGPTTMPSTQAGDVSSTGSGGSSSEASILERMKARREKEMGK